MRHNTRTTQPTTSTKEGRVAKLGLYFVFFVTNYIFSYFLSKKYSSNALNTKGIYIRPSEMLLSNLGR